MSNDTINNAKPVHHELSEFELDKVSGGAKGKTGKDADLPTETLSLNFSTLVLTY
jgi:bacteriocin-like protein